MKKKAKLISMLLVCFITIFMVFTIACPVRTVSDDDDDDDGLLILNPVSNPGDGPWLNPIETDNTSEPFETADEYTDASYDIGYANDDPSSDSTMSVYTATSNTGHVIDDVLTSWIQGPVVSYYDTSYDCIDASDYKFIIFYARYKDRPDDDSIKIFLKDKYGVTESWSNGAVATYPEHAKQIKGTTWSRVVMDLEMPAWQSNGVTRLPDKASIIAIMPTAWGPPDVLLCDDFFFADNTYDSIPTSP